METIACFATRGARDGRSLTAGPRHGQGLQTAPAQVQEVQVQEAELPALLMSDECFGYTITNTDVPSGTMYMMDSDHLPVELPPCAICGRRAEDHHPTSPDAQS